MATVTQSAGIAMRLQFIDNIRWSLIVLVIIHHAAVTYSHLGSWFYHEGPKPGIGMTFLFGTFLAFNQAYFMGFLFLIAGYFTPGAFDRKGFRQFVRDRVIRLGIPALLFMFFIHPVIVYWLLRDFYQPARPSLRDAYLPFIASGRVWSASGPMWFAVALLIFSMVYAILRLAKPHQPRDGQLVARPLLPSNAQVIGLALVIAAATFLVRIVQPSGTSVLNMQLGNFSQYIALFAVGIAAYRRNWLLRIPFSFGISWLWFALTGGVVLWIAILAASGVTRGGAPDKMFGGLHWESALFCLWEALFCMGVSLGLLVLFRDKFDVQGRFARFMSRNAFSAYLFHTPLLIAVTLALHKITAGAVTKFALASLLAVPLTFLASEYVFRRVPLLRQVL